MFDTTFAIFETTGRRLYACRARLVETPRTLDPQDNSLVFSIPYLGRTHAYRQVSLPKLLFGAIPEEKLHSSIHVDYERVTCHHGIGLTYRAMLVSYEAFVRHAFFEGEISERVDSHRVLHTSTGYHDVCDRFF